MLKGYSHLGYVWHIDRIISDIGPVLLCVAAAQNRQVAAHAQLSVHLNGRSDYTYSSVLSTPIEEDRKRLADVAQTRTGVRGPAPIGDLWYILSI